MDSELVLLKQLMDLGEYFDRISDGKFEIQKNFDKMTAETLTYRNKKEKIGSAT